MKEPTIRPELQPYVFASISPYVSEKRPSADVKRPGMSSRSCVSSFDSLISRKLAAIPRMPTGMLTKKIHSQPTCSVSRPPTSGPIASASAEVPAQMPIAVPRSRGGKVAAMIDSVAGFISAAPAPWTIRAPISTLLAVARPQASDEAVKMTIPVTKIRRRPYASASLPPISISAAKVSA